MMLKFAVALLLFVGSAQTFQISGKPNVLAIIIDDAGWKDVGYQGGDIATPEIDALAEGGTRFSNFYAYSTCTPSRAAFFTGKTPSRIGIVYPIQHDDHYGIPPEVVTLPEALRGQGYQTALIGKWHLGVQEELAPLQHGFDYHYGLRGGWFDQYTRENPITGYDWYRDDEVADREEGHTTDLLTEEAVRYLEVSGDEPFFLCLSYTAPHVPVQVDPSWTRPYEEKYDTKTRVGYAGMMAHLDFSIGRVMEALEEKGILEETLVVFFSDNGPSSPGRKWYVPDEYFEEHFYGNDGEYGNVGYLRGWKASPYEGGVKVPAFIYWKGTVASEQRRDLVIVEDFYRTILSLAELELDPGYQPAGRDLFDSGSSVTPLYWRTPRNLAVREGAWKLILHNASPYAENLDAELYNLDEDPAENVNVLSKHPDIHSRLLEFVKNEFGKDPEPHTNPNLLDK